MAAKSIASTYQRQGTLPASYIHTIEWHQQLHQLPGSLLLLKLSVRLVNHLSHHEAAHSLQKNPLISQKILIQVQACISEITFRP